MGKTKRNSDYKNFVDSDKNNLIIIKPKKIVEQVRTFEGEEDFVVQKNNTYLDKGLIVQTNNNPDSIVDVVGVSDSVYKNAGGQITLNGSVTTSANGAYVQISGGQQPYQSVTYTFGSGTGQQSGTASGSSFGVNANFDQANNCYQGGQYNLSVSVTDANGDTGQYTWGGTIQGTCAVSSGSGGSGSGISGQQGNVGSPIGTATPSSGSGVSVQGNVGSPIGTATPSSGSGVSVQGNVGSPIATATPTPTPTSTQVFATPTSPTATYSTSALSGLNVNAILVGTNDIEVSVSYNGGIPQYSILYTTYKDGNIINSTTQSSSTNNDVYVVTGLADGNYTFKVNVSDSNNSNVSTISNMINITTPSVGTPSTGQTGLTPPTGSTSTTTTGGTPSTGQTGQTGGATTTTPPPTTPPTPTTSTNAPILGSGGFQVLEKPIYLERETIIEAETFYSKNKFPIWLLIAIGVYFVATNKNN
jgi:hypothetical protein